MTKAFHIRELQFQDHEGRQVVLRVSDGGDVDCSGVFDNLGVQVKKEEKIELSIRIKQADKEVISTMYRLCRVPDEQGNYIYVPC